MELLLIILAVIAVAYLVGARNTSRPGLSQGGHRRGGGLSLEDEKAEARRWIERLGGQVLNLTGTDTPSKQALADASERYNAAASQIEQATSAHQAQLAKESALEGLYYIRAARTAMGMDPGPELPKDPVRERAGEVSEDRSIQYDGREYELSADPSERTPHYYPGGRVAGRPVPRGWYSEPWWRPALLTGVWAVGSMMMFNMMFMGMAGIASAAAWEQGFDAGQEAGGDSADSGDGGDGADGGYDGGDGGYDGGGYDGGGYDSYGGGGYDGGGFDGGGGFDIGGGFDF